MLMLAPAPSSARPPCRVVYERIAVEQFFRTLPPQRHGRAIIMAGGCVWWDRRGRGRGRGGLEEGGRGMGWGGLEEGGWVAG